MAWEEFISLVDDAWCFSCCDVFIVHTYDSTSTRTFKDVLTTMFEFLKDVLVHL
jgi:hypothetical protein